MTKARRFSRRTMLRGLVGGAAAAVALPLLDVMVDDTGVALADSGAYPRRFGLFFWGNGMNPDFWAPAVTGTGYELTPQLAPLANVKQYLTVVSGYEVKVPNAVTHHSGACGMLTGIPLQVSGQSDYKYNGPSIDQILAQEIGGLTRFRSLEYGARPGQGLSLTDGGSFNPPITSPFELYERLFGQGTLPTNQDGPDPRLLMRQSVLDAVLTDANTLQAIVPPADKQRIERQLDTIRDLERQLAAIAEGGPPPAACVVPEAPLGPFDEGSDQAKLMAANRAMTDLAVMSLVCDQTRVLSNYLTRPLSDVLWDDTDDSHHLLTHHEGGDQPQVHTVTVGVMTELAYMLEALAAIDEGGESLLDHCAVMATSDVSLGRIHSLDEFPLLIAGSACGRLVTGTHIRSEVGDNIAKATLSVMRSVGALLESFGVADAYTADGLSELEV